MHPSLSNTFPNQFSGSLSSTPPSQNKPLLRNAGTSLAAGTFGGHRESYGVSSEGSSITQWGLFNCVCISACNALHRDPSSASPSGVQDDAVSSPAASHTPKSRYARSAHILSPPATKRNALDVAIIETISLASKFKSTSSRHSRGSVSSEVPIVFAPSAPRSD